MKPVIIAVVVVLLLVLAGGAYYFLAPKFKFVPFMDSPEGDIVQRSGNVEQLKAACLADPNCKGFNTNGWMKKIILPESRWVRWTNDTAQGMYIKL